MSGGSTWARQEAEIDRLRAELAEEQATAREAWAERNTRILELADELEAARNLITEQATEILRLGKYEPKTGARRWSERAERAEAAIARVRGLCVRYTSRAFPECMHVEEFLRALDGAE